MSISPSVIRRNHVQDLAQAVQFANSKSGIDAASLATLTDGTIGSEDLIAAQNVLNQANAKLQAAAEAKLAELNLTDAVLQNPILAEMITATLKSELGAEISAVESAQALVKSASVAVGAKMAESPNFHPSQAEANVRAEAEAAVQELKNTLQMALQGQGFHYSTDQISAGQIAPEHLALVKNQPQVQQQIQKLAQISANFEAVGVAKQHWIEVQAEKMSKGTQWETLHGIVAFHFDRLRELQPYLDAVGGAVEHLPPSMQQEYSAARMQLQIAQRAAKFRFNDLVSSGNLSGSALDSAWAQYQSIVSGV